MLVSLISRLVACSPRIVVDKQTDTHVHTERLLYPRCACAPRVNYATMEGGLGLGATEHDLSIRIYPLTAYRDCPPTRPQLAPPDVSSPLWAVSNSPPAMVYVLAYVRATCPSPFIPQGACQWGRSTRGARPLARPTQITLDTQRREKGKIKKKKTTRLVEATSVQ